MDKKQSNDILESKKNINLRLIARANIMIFRAKTKKNKLKILDALISLVNKN